MKELLLVCAGGAFGSGARHLVSTAVSSHARRAFSSDFPWGTLAVNAIGSFLLGVLLAWGEPGGPDEPSRTTRVLLGTGALGGFTTYSTFNWETLWQIQQGRTGTAMVYVAATLVVCLTFGLLGATTARALSH